MSTIDGVGGPASPQQGQLNQGQAEKSSSDDGGFRSAMSRVAGATASGLGKVAGAVPGSAALGLAAEGLNAMRSDSSGSLPGAGDDQIEQMFEMQKQSQAFNLQYLELQNRIQEDNRQFSTLSNLMKVRHDTAKSAINNMHV